MNSQKQREASKTNFVRYLVFPLPPYFLKENTIVQPYREKSRKVKEAERSRKAENSNVSESTVYNEIDCC